MDKFQIIDKMKNSIFKDKFGNSYKVEFTRGISPKELSRMSEKFQHIGKSQDMKGLLLETQGWNGPYLESMFFSPFLHENNGLEKFIKYGVYIESDNKNNYIVMEILDSGELGKIYYFGLDPKVIILIANSLDEFLQLHLDAFLTMEISKYHELVMKKPYKIWEEDKNILTLEEFIKLNPEYVEDLVGYNDNYLIADLRELNLGQGIAWGYYEVIGQLNKEKIIILKKCSGKLIKRFKRFFG